MQVTISLLPVSLSLVHIPRSRLESLSRPLLRQILRGSAPGFLNMTCNEIELSVFAESGMVGDFEEVARRDLRRMKRGSRSGKAEHEGVEMSSERWSVLQIDSHSDQIDNSGTRVYDLSAPLAAAGISILYQSSYMSDFIFVKETRLQESIDLFASAGFEVYTEERAEDPPPPTTDNLPPTHPKKQKSHSPTSAQVRILHPDLACVGLSEELGVDHWGLKIVKLVAFPDLIDSTLSSSSSSSSASSPVSSCSSFSSSSSDDDDGYYSHSSPIPSPSPSFSPKPIPSSSSSNSSSQTPFFSFTRTPEGSSLTADVRVLAALFPPGERHMVICSGELDNADADPEQEDDPSDGEQSLLEDREEEEQGVGRSLKCLQIDLRRFGLDKHGLVTRFSRVLEENGINHMYSSTFKTANLLVDKRLARRAQSLLRAC